MVTRTQVLLAVGAFVTILVVVNFSFMWSLSSDRRVVVGTRGDGGSSSRGIVTKKGPTASLKHCPTYPHVTSKEKPVWCSDYNKKHPIYKILDPHFQLDGGKKQADCFTSRSAELMFLKNPTAMLKKHPDYQPCPGQKVNHFLRTQYHMIDKDRIYKALRERSRSTGAFDVDRMYPKSFVLDTKEDCLAWLDYEKQILADFASQGLSTSNTTLWIVKQPRNSHNAQGIYLARTSESVISKDDTHKSLHKAFDYPRSLDDICKHQKLLLVQLYLNNPLLIGSGRKFDFRVYMLVAQAEPALVFYHDGFLRVSLSEYDAKSDDFGAHITNRAAQSKNHEKGDKGWTKDMTWTYLDLESYLKEIGMCEEGWTDEYLIPTMKFYMVNIFRSVVDKLASDAGSSQYFGLYGVDFILDSDLHLWFMEINQSPAYNPDPGPKSKIIPRLLKETMQLMYDYSHDVLDESKYPLFDKIIDDREEYEYAPPEAIVNQ